MTKSIKAFLILYFLFFAGGMVLFLNQNHGDLVLWLSERHTPSLDQFFKYFTYLGDGITLIVIAVLLITFRRKFGFILGLIGIIQANVSFVLKRWVFGRVPRPKKFFDDISQLNFVEGVEVNGFYSFPSGHTMTAFSIALFLAYYFRKPWVSALLVIGATLVAISRMYLLQHFLIDVLAGSLVGVIIAYVGCRFFRNYLES